MKIKPLGYDTFEQLLASWLVMGFIWFFAFPVMLLGELAGAAIPQRKRRL